MKRFIDEADLPTGFTYTPEFPRMLEAGLSLTEPWWLLEGWQLQERYDGLRVRFPDRELVPFAKRLDRDDVACWDNRDRKCVYVLHDFSDPKRPPVAVHPDFYSFLKAALDDAIEHDAY